MKPNTAVAVTLSGPVIRSLKWGRPQGPVEGGKGYSKE